MGDHKVHRGTERGSVYLQVNFNLIQPKPSTPTPPPRGQIVKSPSPELVLIFGFFPTPFPYL